MNETAIARVDSDVIDAMAVGVEMRTEENHIAGQQRTERHRMCRLPLSIGRARDVEPNALMHISDEPAAVEALGVGPAKLIGRSDDLRRRSSDRSPTIGVPLGCGGWRAGATRDYPAREQQKHCGKAPRDAHS
jgi:hypothetical protein